MMLLRRTAPVLLLCAAVGGYWLMRHGHREGKTPPEIATDDSAVAEAVRTCRERILAAPHDSKEWGRLGRICLANGFVDPARECFAEAARLDPAEPRWPYFEGICFLQRDPVLAMDCWRRSAECVGRSDMIATARLRWGESLLQNDRAEEAARVFNEELKADGQSIRARLGAGLAARQLGRTAEAAGHLRPCTEDPSSRKLASAMLAALMTASGDTVLAAEYSKRSESLPPDRPWPDPFLQELIPDTIGRQALFIQAEQLMAGGDPRQAVDLLQKLIQDHPDDGRAYAKLGMLLAEQGDLPGAEHVLRRGVERTPSVVQIHFALAATLFQEADAIGFSTPAGRAKLESTLEAASRAIELKSDHGFAHLYRGLAKVRLGRVEEGIASLREAVACTPDAVDPHLHLGQTLMEHANREEGLEQLRTADRLSSENDRRAKKLLTREK